jgi:hypothetical protein
MRNEAAGITRGATPVWMWVALLSLTLLTAASFVLHFKLYASSVAQLPITPAPHWGWWLRYEWYLPAAIASLAILVFAPAALALRRWRPFALALLALAAFAQTAFLGLEHYWKQQERAGEFERPLPWMPEP